MCGGAWQSHGVGHVRPCGATRRALQAGGASRSLGAGPRRDPPRVCERGYDPERRTFTQYYGSGELYASILNIPLVGFLAGTDERVTGTIDAVWGELSRDGLVSRYSTAETDDGLAGDERRGE
jgi:hypothetical protein